jgi:hypothetical protein
MVTTKDSKGGRHPRISIIQRSKIRRNQLHFHTKELSLGFGLGFMNKKPGPVPSLFPITLSMRSQIEIAAK